MSLRHKLLGRLAGSGPEKARRAALLTALLDAFERGVEGASSEPLRQRMSELDSQFRDRLRALEQQL